MSCSHRYIAHGYCEDCGATSQEIYDADIIAQLREQLKTCVAKDEVAQLLRENIALRGQLYGQVKDNAEYKELLADRQKQVCARFALKAALDKIIAIPNKTNGGDWDEIEEARKIAKEAIEADAKKV